ncbi:rnf5 [Dorcoceras hygrometricum]|uniref:E3 ubiquitin-protein ligase RMA n=1 Tax=Dorcoceras hygrometricum TaxID=472368 RepID=A0A2Z7AEY8_9LAMI|nr:rnf5 [Dorcoceras hygrometricum]
METGFGETMPSCSGSDSSDAANFECNICFELAQDPIVTLCGHLFCWPCLYKWLHVHSLSPECPVCKAGIEEEKLVPLYGRGKNTTDPRSKSIPGMEIPHRPVGQRPETAPAPAPAPNAQQGYEFMGGFGSFGGFTPVATAGFGDFVSPTGIGSLIPSIFNIQVHGFPVANMHREGPGFHYGYPSAFHGGHAQGFPVPQRSDPQEQADSRLKLLLLAVGFCLLLTLIWS